MQDKLAGDFPFLEPYATRRLIRAYGTEAWDVLGDAKSAADLGQTFGATITARELDWAVAREYVRSGDDFLWRRTKLGLRLDADQRAAVDGYITEKATQKAA